MEYLLDYLSFMAKIFSVAFLIVLALIVILGARQNQRRGNQREVKITRLNESLQSLTLDLESVILSSKIFKQKLKNKKKLEKEYENRSAGDVARYFVCHFKGDIQASAVEELRDEVTAILQVATTKDTVIIVIESAGGTIHGYGLAASQLRRIREKNIRLIAAIDKIAASGGYMMACVAHEIVAAPFAIVGSIGVVAQIPNFNKLLKRNDIEFELVTAGKHKRTLTMFGENQNEDREKFQEELDEMHRLFKQFVVDARPHLDIEKVSTGEYWLGSRALELGLIDKTSTSDDLLIEAAAQADVFKVFIEKKHSFLKKVVGPFSRLLGPFNQ